LAKTEEAIGPIVPSSWGFLVSFQDILLSFLASTMSQLQWVDIESIAPRCPSKKLSILHAGSGLGRDFSAFDFH
jgi:hypothetical protein